MSTTTKTVLWIIVILVVAIGAYAIFGGGDEAVSEDVDLNNGGNSVVCTMDAKLCPDGSYVGRVGPNCEFAACPGAGTGTGTGFNGGESFPADILK